MWFKNLTLFRAIGADRLDGPALQEALAAAVVRPCGKLEPMTMGWISPYDPDDERMVHTVGKCHLLRFARRERVLPPAVVRERVAERAAAFRDKTGRRPTRRQQVNLRDEVMMELLPQAFVKPAYVDCCLDAEAGWFAVNAAGGKRSEEVATGLRYAVDGLQLQAIDAANRIRTVMSGWLEAGRCADDFALGEECDLRDDRDAGSTVRCRKQDLEAPEIGLHLKAGKRAVKLGLIWADRLAFSLGEDFTLARLKPLDLLLEQMEAVPDGDGVAALDAEFALMTLELRALIEALVKALELPIE